MTVRDLRPGSSYGGTVYTRTVVAAVGDGPAFAFEDPTREITAAATGSVLAVELVGQSVSGVEPNPDGRPGLRPTAAGAVDVRGRVAAMHAGAEHPLQVDVGAGSLRVDAAGTSGVEPGDWVVIPGTRLFLRSVAGDRP